MKKMIILLMMMALFVPAAFSAQIVKDSEFILPYWGDPWPPDYPDQLLTYGSWSFLQTWGFYFTGEVAVLSGYGDPGPPSWGTASIWQDTGEVFQANTVYTMTVRWYDGPENGGETTTDISTVNAQIISITDPGGPSETWTDVVDVVDTPVAVSVWQDLVVVLDTANHPEIVGDNVGVGFRLTSETGAWVYIDSIILTYPSASNPVPPHDSDPTDDLNEVGIINESGRVDLTLQWDPVVGPNDVTNHFIYLRENDPNWLSGAIPYVTLPGEVNTCDLTEDTGRDLNVGSIYYWRVDEGIDGSAYNEPGTIKGMPWAFETVGLRPIITEHPEDMLVPDGGVAAFSVTATSDPSYPITSYEWYLSTDAVNDTPGDDTSMGTGNPSSYIVSAADGGKYAYCVASNSSGSATSEVALLEVERLMGHWKLDGNLESYPVNDQPGIAGETSFVAADAIDGKAAEFFGVAEPNYVIAITGSENSYNNFHLGLSISTWVKTSFSGNWQIIAGKQDRATPGSEGWTFNIDPVGAVQLVIGLSAITETSVNDGEWHLITGTFDGSVTKVYVDGLLDATSGSLATPIDTTIMNTQPFEIGGESATSTFTTEGLLDDVKIFSYALHPTEVLDIYNEYADVKLNSCVAEYARTFDTNGPAGEPDCKIDLYDFADMAAVWLTDGCYGDPGTYPCDM